MKIGSFGTRLKKLPESAAPEKYDTFDWCETEIRLRPFVASFPMLAYAAYVNHENILMTLEFGENVHGVLKASIHEEDWGLFAAVSEENEVGLSDLWELSQHLFARWTNLPIQRVSASSSGHSETTPEEESNTPLSEQLQEWQLPDSSESQNEQPGTLSSD